MEYFRKMELIQALIKGLITLLLTVGFFFLGAFILLHIWLYFAPIFNLPVLSFWEILILQIGVRTLIKGLPISIENK